MTQLDDKALSAVEFASSYEWESEDGSYTPNDQERAMIEDAIEGYLSQATQAGEIETLKSDVVFIGELVESFDHFGTGNGKNVAKDEARTIEAWQNIITTLTALKTENERLRERLDIGSNGEDAIDVAESAMGHLRHQIETLQADNERLRSIIANMGLKLRSIRYHADNGHQDRPAHVRLRLISDEANKGLELATLAGLTT